MSFAIVEGEPTAKQLMLDRQLEALVLETGREEDRYCFGKLVLKCLRDHAAVVNSLDGSSGRTTTNGEMLEKSLKVARAMTAAGVRAGDVVMITGVNRLELVVPFYAAFFNSNLPINVDIGATVYELSNVINITKPKIIFSDGTKLESLEKSLAECQVKPIVVSFDDTDSSHETLSEFMRPFSGNVESFKCPDSNRDDAALLLSTSGSTGLPKVSALTNYCLVAQLPIFTTSELIFDESQFPFGSVRNLVIMSSQWFGYYSAVSVAAAYGFQRVQTPQPPLPQHVLQIIRKFKPNTVFLSPSYVSTLLTHPEYRPGDLGSLYTVIVTGAVIAPQLRDDLKRAMHPAGVVAYTYGCSELGGGLLQPSETFVPGSIGRQQNILHYRIVDEEGNEVKDGDIGELWLKPKETFFKGYYGNEPATREVLSSDGWFHTGDMVRRDHTGDYFFVERKNLLITFNNYHIYPSELEKVVGAMDGVAEVAVCGTASGPAALVVARAGRELNAQAIRDVVAEKLSVHKQLAGGVFFVTSIPKTVSGKVNWSKLKHVLGELQK